MQKEERKCIFGEITVGLKCPIISLIAAKKLVRQGCVAYLYCVTKDRKEKVKLKDMPVVEEFPDMFLEKIPGLPPKGRLPLK